jgi:cobalt-zinc-cadmium efflux system protein
MLLNAVPEGINASRVRERLLTVPGVTEVHDLHVWSVSTSNTALTVHLVMPGCAGGDAIYRDIQAILREKFGIGHVTRRSRRVIFLAHTLPIP